jgi:hypothetical protein
VSRLWRENDLQPWRQGTFKISQDPNFEDKVQDVVGLYLSPPEGEAVVSVDAKTGIQALDRTQPLLPMTFGKTEKPPMTMCGMVRLICTRRSMFGLAR